MHGSVGERLRGMHRRAIAAGRQGGSWGQAHLGCGASSPCRFLRRDQSLQTALSKGMHESKKNTATLALLLVFVMPFLWFQDLRNPLHGSLKHE